MSIHELPQPPPDVVSSLAFSSDNNTLIVSSWSPQHGILVYQRSASSPPFELAATIATPAPVLDLCFGADDNTVYYVGLNQTVRRHHLHGHDDESLVRSSHATSKVAHSKEHNLVLALSWNGTLFVIDAASEHSAAAVPLAAKPFALSLTADKAVVTMAERKVHVYALAELKALVVSSAHGADAPLSQKGGVPPVVGHVKPWQERESSLKFMTRASAAMPDGTGFAASSIEGRVGVEWFDEEANQKMYAFKCHRDKSTTTDEAGQEVALDIIYPVNAIAFHPVHGTFATGGGDGVVALWDAKTKRRIRQYPKLPSSVAALTFSPDGKSLAIGISPGFEDGHEQDIADPELVKVYVRELAESEAKGKPAKEK
jgi:cell cycle arrest protein BUB3